MEWTCDSLAKLVGFFFSSRRRHTRWPRDWSSDVCSSDLPAGQAAAAEVAQVEQWGRRAQFPHDEGHASHGGGAEEQEHPGRSEERRVGKECRSRGGTSQQKGRKAESGRPEPRVREGWRRG